ncbi:MAG: ATP-binding cassette domain-containing protein [Bifidobacteriaceae bacterium]|nr:ATP-binding cassette domain-containing protein [Bifidobacteriaceae bacterium]
MSGVVAAASGLDVALGGHRVLHDVSFEIRAGEAVGLLGANGSGKSTLVKTMLGLIQPLRGRAELFGEPPGRRVPWAKVAYVPQDSPAGSGVPTSALEVVVSGLMTGPRPWPPRRAKARALAALELVGMEGRARDTLKNLSGGQRHRVLLARALVRRPQLLIMDEPLAGVDAASAESLVAALRGMAGLTTVVVLHETGPFADYLTRAIVLDGGRIAADGPPPPGAAAPVHHHHDLPHPGRSQTPDLTALTTSLGTGRAGETLRPAAWPQPGAARRKSPPAPRDQPRTARRGHSWAPERALGAGDPS